MALWQRWKRFIPRSPPLCSVTGAERAMLVIFDCDGTLVDSQANIIAAMTESFERNNLVPPDHQSIRRIVGLSLVETMQKLLPEAAPDLHQHMADDYKQAFFRLRAAGALAQEPLYPGIRALIEALHADGVTLGVATGKSDRGLALCLAHHGLADYFTTLQTADRHPSKPHPSMIHQCLADSGKNEGECWMIGDTVFDIHMAVNAGVKSIGVDWGYHDAHELQAAGAAHIVADTLSLQQIVRSAV
jgi:phosphoglycolate phosphatase